MTRGPTFDITGAARLHRAASVLMDGLGLGICEVKKPELRCESWLRGCGSEDTERRTKGRAAPKPACTTPRWRLAKARKVECTKEGLMKSNGVAQTDRAMENRRKTWWHKW